MTVQLRQLVGERCTAFLRLTKPHRTKFVFRATIPDDFDWDGVESDSDDDGLMMEGKNNVHTKKSEHTSKKVNTSVKFRVPRL